MATRLPTILATSGGFAESARLDWEVGPLTRFAVELTGVIGRAPRVCFLGTASGDDRRLITTFYDNAWRELGGQPHQPALHAQHRGFA